MGQAKSAIFQGILGGERRNPFGIAAAPAPPACARYSTAPKGLPLTSGTKMRSGVDLPRTVTGGSSSSS